MELQHHGVKGQKWGVRKQVESSSQGRTAVSEVAKPKRKPRQPLTRGQKAARTRKRNLRTAEEQRKAIKQGKRITNALVIGGAIGKMAMSKYKKPGNSLNSLGRAVDNISGAALTAGMLRAYGPLAWVMPIH